MMIKCKKDNSFFSDLLKNKKCKVTLQRLNILSSFDVDCNPKSADDILLSVKDIDQVTVYRNLIFLEKKGLIRRVDIRKQSVHYELITDHHHHHVVCRSCGLVEKNLVDFCKRLDIDNLSKKILKSSSKFSSLDGHSLDFVGLCKKCA